MKKEDAYETLRMEIVTNKVAPGDIFNEKELMARLSIGRSPLREVLFRLQEEHLIKPLPRLGYMVTTLDIADVRELVELRRELEGFAGALAAGRITSDQLEAIRTIVHEAEQNAPEKQDFSSISEYYDTRFHDVLYQAAGNQHLSEVLQDLHIKMLRVWFHVGLEPIGFSRDSQNFNMILEALENGDSEKAREAMKSHVDLHSARVKEKFL